jgi:hypothetical protein
MTGDTPGRRSRKVSVVAAGVLGLASAAAATAGEPGWRLEGALGAAHSLSSTLTVEQEGFPTLELDADWEGRSLESPLYYGLRVARGDAHGAWALRFVHLKVYLAHPTVEVERFSVSHGYNLLTLERSLPLGGFDLWAGLGIVIAHPESTIRGRTRPESEGGPLGGGYYITGPTASMALGRSVRVAGRFALVPEIRLSLSRGRVPIAGGEASVPNAALHALLGVEIGL